MIDLDYFKRINDTYGHLAGDEVLRVHSAVLKRFVTEADHLFRYGGEEFLMLKRRSRKMSDLRQFAETVRETLAEASAKVDEGMLLNVTVSIGADGQPERSRNASEAIRLADQALYQAK